MYPMSLAKHLTHLFAQLLMTPISSLDYLSANIRGTLSKAFQTAVPKADQTGIAPPTRKLATLLSPAIAVIAIFKVITLVAASGALVRIEVSGNMPRLQKKKVLRRRVHWNQMTSMRRRGT